MKPLIRCSPIRNTGTVLVNRFTNATREDVARIALRIDLYLPGDRIPYIDQFTTPVPLTNRPVNTVSASSYQIIPPHRLAGITATDKATQTGSINLRMAEGADLEAVNELIEVAMDTWDLSDRVKRISLPLYRYQAHDLEHLQVVVAETVDSRLVGVAAVEQPVSGTHDTGCCTAMLHGIYVAADDHRKGIGSLLLASIEKLASRENVDGLLVKARPEASSFFRARGFAALPVDNHSRDYPYRYFKHL